MRFTTSVMAAVFAAAAVCAAVPVYVMLPLDLVDEHGLRNPGQLQRDLLTLRNAGVRGVMTDVWWGLAEPTARKYNFTAYKDLAAMCQNTGLKLQVVMSFHRCGGNVGDTCNISLPSFVGEVGRHNSDIYYKDNDGRSDEEYITLGADNQALFGGRTPLDMYADFMNAFAAAMNNELGSVIDGVSVSLGPASELRYPGYQSDKGWKYCGVGEFQANDKYMRAALASAAQTAGHSEWGYAQPNNAGSWNSRPYNTGFFSSNGFDNYASDYGRFFLGWYSEMLMQHGDDVLSRAKKAFGNKKVELAVKVSGIHWWYDDNSHAAELTSGYYNTNNNDAYYTIAQRISKYADVFDFTCLEMTDSSNDCGSKPATLVQQAMTATQRAGLKFDGENAIELCTNNCDQNGFNQIVAQASKGAMAHFTYLRLTRNLLDNVNNLNVFTNFVSKMASI